MRLGLKGTSPTVECVSLTGKKREKNFTDSSMREPDMKKKEKKHRRL
jgi:hypothetical protein